MIDEHLTLKNAVVQVLSETFAESGKVKCLTEKLDIDNSIQFLTKKSDSSTDWRTEKHVLVLYPALSFAQALRSNPSMNAEQLLIEILGQIPNPECDRIHIFLHKQKSRTGSGDSDKTLEAELNRLLLDKALELSSEALIMYKTDLNLEPLDDSGATQRALRTTKSILELIQMRSTLPTNNDEDDLSSYGSWYPKKSGPPVSVSKNKIGLHNLWQRYLMQTSKTLNIEHAKVIAADPGFASIDRTMDTYAPCLNDEKKAVELLSTKPLRPAGATIAGPALGRSRPSVGPETSRKVFKVLTSLDANTKI